MKNKSIVVSIALFMYKHPTIAKVIYYTFWPIIAPLAFCAERLLKWITFRQLKTISDNNQHYLINTAVNYLNFKIATNKWKSKISKKWFDDYIFNIQKQLYEAAIKDKSIMSFEMFSTLLQVYSQYNIVGTGRINRQGDTIINVQ